MRSVGSVVRMYSGSQASSQSSGPCPLPDTGLSAPATSPPAAASIRAQPAPAPSTSSSLPFPAIGWLYPASTRDDPVHADSPDRLRHRTTRAGPAALARAGLLL